MSGIGLKRLQHLVLWVSDVDRSVPWTVKVSAPLPSRTLSISRSLIAFDTWYRPVMGSTPVILPKLIPPGKFTSSGA